MNLKKLEKKDYSAMKRIFLDVFSNEPWFDKWRDDKQLEKYLHQLTDNKNSLSLVLTNERDEILGVSLGYTFSWWQGDEYYIKEFFIKRNRQNEGLGSKFIEKLNDYLKEIGFKYIILNTDKDTPAFHFYQKNDFQLEEKSVFMSRIVD
ncbi:GNAT family N-acetyltransferase [Halanaerobium saccharolyticum]|uniref:GNAT family N-acetyltransferase n=1 Tax=Halanaerobium saccharolyticum TaxID=43595 RepID=UPI003FCCA8EC